ncbi:hypothetical protein P3T35_002373 [Kitasatospora sp. GP30]|nr:hypothetical protein [Kitasatospora sp. GP30]
MTRPPALPSQCLYEVSFRAVARLLPVAGR